MSRKLKQNAMKTKREKQPKMERNETVNVKLEIGEQSQANTSHDDHSTMKSAQRKYKEKQEERINKKSTRERIQFRIC